MKRLKVLASGGRGMLGRTLQKELSSPEIEILPCDLPEADITDAKAIDAFIRDAAPDAVIHCAAMTAVDKCETQADLAYKVNAAGSANVAAACDRQGVRLIAISTDYVFGDTKSGPYDEFDAPSPLNVYGRSKLAGEESVRRHCPNHVIARVSWLYGAGGPSFVHTMLRLADGTRPELKVVCDQIGSPTSALAAARKLKEILLRPEIAGTFHMTCEGETDWASFAEEIFKLAGVKQAVARCSTEEYLKLAQKPGQPIARRPLNSRLDKMMLRLQGFSPMPHWREALEEFLKLEPR